MLGHVTESIDYNLPVDAITRKPVFAFSCNRRIRETYNGPLLRTVDGDVYPVDLASSEDKRVVKLYDQKVKYGCVTFNVEAVGDVFLRKKAGKLTEDPSRPTEVSSSDVGRKIKALMTIPSRGLEEGKVYEIEGVNTVSKRHMFFPSETGNPLGVVNIVHVGTQWVFAQVGPPYYYIELSPGAYFEAPGMAAFFTEDAGVLTVCDPSNSDGRAPIFSASNNDNELCFDVGSAYMRFNHYKISERHQLFGGLDSPDQNYSAYLGNFSNKTTIRNTSGFSGVSLRKDAISSVLTDGYIGRDATGNTYSGEIYELIIGNFEIPNDSVNEAFRDMVDFYALT